MKLIPREYQQRAVKQTKRLLKAGKRVLVCAPGGSGKTVIIAMLAHDTWVRGGRVLVVSHRREIVKQALEHLRLIGISREHISIVMAEEEETLGASIFIASKDTLKNRKLPKVDRVIVDECHHVVANEYQAILDRFSRAEHIGLTATPFRLDGTGLGNVYDDMVVAELPSELIANRYLANPRIFTTVDQFLPNLKAVRVVHGEFHIGQLTKEISRRPLIGNIATTLGKHGRDKTTIVFAVTVEHSLAITSRLRSVGIKAAHIDGTMSVTKREEILRKFREGRVTALSNCMILSEGFDLPKCQLVVLARPTKSLALYLQQANRGMRYYKGERPVILDHARNVLTFGLPQANRVFSLDGLDPEDADQSPTKVCNNPECLAVVPLGTLECPECGFSFPAQEPRRDPRETKELLKELTLQESKKIEENLRKHAKDSGKPESWIQAVMAQWLAVRGVAG